jgi:hypothetical protein
MSEDLELKLIKKIEELEKEIQYFFYTRVQKKQKKFRPRISTISRTH